MKNAGLVAIVGIFKQSGAAPIDLNLQPSPSCHRQGSDGTVDVGISGLDEATSSAGQVVNGAFYTLQHREHYRNQK